MKETVQVSLVQLDSKLFDRPGNARRMAEWVDKEASKGAELVVFPELANVGYTWPFHDFDPKFARTYYDALDTIPGETTGLLGEVARARGCHVVVGLGERHRRITSAIFNSAVVIGPHGRIIGMQRKMHIPAGEKHYFTPGDALRVIPTDLGPIGISICHDGRYPETARVLAVQGAEIICAIWVRFHQQGYLAPEGNHYMAFVRAQENALWYLFCNRGGVQGEYRFLGHSAVGAPNGELVASTTQEDEIALCASLSADRLVNARLFNNIFQARRPSAYWPLTKSMEELALLEPTPGAIPAEIDS